MDRKLVADYHPREPRKPVFLRTAPTPKVQVNRTGMVLFLILVLTLAFVGYAVTLPFIQP